jgi:hypothetical protein
MTIAVAGADAVMTFDEIEQQFPDTHKFAIQNLVNYIENEMVHIMMRNDETRVKGPNNCQ